MPSAVTSTVRAGGLGGTGPFVPSVKDDDRWFDPPRVHATSLESVFTIPLVYGNEVLGVLGLDSPRFSADRPPTEAHIARLEALVAQAAIAIAQSQKARSFELRAALSLAKLYRATNREADAHAVLAPAVEGFPPTQQFSELTEAQALLQRAVAIRNHRPHDIDTESVLTLEQYAAALRLNGHGSDAAAVETRARRMRAELKYVVKALRPYVVQ